MQSIRIVETLDPINQIKSRLRARCISQSIDPFDFQRLEEAFHRRIVSASSLPTHRLHRSETIEQIPMFLAGVLHARRMGDTLLKNCRRSRTTKANLRTILLRPRLEPVRPY